MKYSEKGVYDTIPAQAMRQKSTEYSNAEQCRVQHGVCLIAVWNVSQYWPYSIF